MDRRQQLFDRDVRKDSEPLDPISFLDNYVASNFPQTSAYPSKEQRENEVTPSTEENELNFKKAKKIPSGTSYDRPQVS
jgi:hypothetical protein|tara:strand:+ start:10635 stop:10871 length:237 start_codon:yes stop_codon:yes gene_type:complete